MLFFLLSLLFHSFRDVFNKIVPAVASWPGRKVLMSATMPKDIRDVLVARLRLSNVQCVKSPSLAVVPQSVDLSVEHLPNNSAAVDCMLRLLKPRLDTGVLRTNKSSF
jgi:superfamily II DNA/RNA helicase